MKEEFVSIANIPTHILTWGSSISEKFDSKEIVICIPGNPGLPEAYTRFLSTIHSKVGSNIPVWIVGHAGHSEPDILPLDTDLIIPDLAGNKSSYGLQGQVEHKIEFIKKYVPDDVKIHLIGHSIGAWIIIEILKNSEIKQKIQHCYLLFPTIERMAITSSGRILTKLILPFWFLIRCFFLILCEIPKSWQLFIIARFLSMIRVSGYFRNIVYKYIQPPIMEKIVHMAREEMIQVCDIDLETIKNNKSKLKFYYGATDGWVPKKYFYQLKEKIPDLNGEIDQLNCEHAFVMKSSIEMGKMVADWILRYKC